MLQREKRADPFGLVTIQEVCTKRHMLVVLHCASLLGTMMSSSFIICRHPDKNSDPEAQEKFIKVNEAHEVRHIRKLGATTECRATLDHLFYMCKNLLKN